MTVKEHYDNHLADFYSWMIGDFTQAKNNFKDFCIANEIKPIDKGIAIDLGAGNGIQSIALGELGFKVKAIDFNEKLLSELESKVEDLPIEIINDNITHVKSRFSEQSFELIVCCGDTIAHLNTFEELGKLIQDCYDLLQRGGKLILSFRDYSIPLTDTQRFIPVKSDDTRILTCIIDYSDEKVKVTDLLYEKINGNWIQKVSSYDKLRIRTENIIVMSEAAGFTLLKNTSRNRMVYLILEKSTL